MKGMHYPLSVEPASGNPPVSVLALREEDAPVQLIVDRGGQRLCLVGCGLAVATALLQRQGRRRRTRFGHALDAILMHEQATWRWGDLRPSDAVLIGPTPLTAATEKLILRLSTTDAAAFLGLAAHSTVAGAPFFPIAARCCDYIQIDPWCARSLDGTATDSLQGMLRLRYLAGDNTTCVLLNGARGGWMCCGDGWEKIRSPLIKVVDDSIYQQTFAAAFVLARQLLGLDTEPSLEYAIGAAAGCWPNACDQAGFEPQR